MEFMERKIRVGVVGTGRQAQSFLKLYAEHPKIELTAVCDVSEERLTASAERWGVKHRFNDLSICECGDVDMISVHTPDHLHAEPFIRALEGGKHIFVEKPMADNEADLLRMVEAAKRASTKTMVGHILRFNPLFSTTKTMIQEERKL